MISILDTTIKRAALSLLCRLESFVPRDDNTSTLGVEQDLFDRFTMPIESVPTIFILASPRTGSTLLYQMMAKYFRMHYFSNYVAKHFPENPLVGTVIESVLTEGLDEDISLRNKYGETEGPHEPSEATQILRSWFPDEHPTETLSARVRKGKRPHIMNTMAGIAALTGKQIVIKNAWNCFRVRELASLFPASRFIWLRRDIAASSYSALLARRTQGDPATIWNSASPANLSEIKRLPYIEQVVEQQFWTNDAVRRNLRRYVPDDRQVEVWYENITDDPLSALGRISECVLDSQSQGSLRDLTSADFDLQSSRGKVESNEFDQILRYAEKKYPEFIRQQPGSTPCSV